MAANDRTKAATAENEDTIHMIQALTGSAYERFTSGEISSTQLKEFYELVSSWGAATSAVFASAAKLGIQV